MKKICFMLLGNPPSNETDVSEHWLKFISTVDPINCVFVNHPINRINKEQLEDYKNKYDYLTAFEKKLGSENIYICNQDDNTHIKTMWANISIVYAEIMMLQEAVMKFGLCEKYILISASCCPLYNYKTICDTLSIDDKSWISIMSSTPFVRLGLTEFYTMSQKEQLDKTSDIFNYYAGLKVSQWLILSAKHVKYLYAISTQEQRERTYLYDGELECREGIVTTIKFNSDLKDSNCDKDNCIDEIVKFINFFDKNIKSQLPNCVITPYDEYAIQQFILNKILNNADKNKYLTNKNELLKILQNEFRIMSFEYIKRNVDDNYSKLNKEIKNIKLDFFYNAPTKNTAHKDNSANIILLNNHPSIISQSNNLIKTNEEINTYNMVYFGRKFKTYPCHSIKFNFYEGINTPQNCDEVVLNDYVFIGSTYTNWLLITNNLSNYSRAITFNTTISEKELDNIILNKIFMDKNKNKIELDQYLTYIKINSPLFYELEINECIKNIYDSNVILPDDYQQIIDDIERNQLYGTPPIPRDTRLTDKYHLNKELLFRISFYMNPFFVLSEEDKDITKYSSVQDFLTKVYDSYKKNNCETNFSELVLEILNNVIFKELSTDGINISYHPSEYFITTNKENMFVNVSNYLKKILCVIKEKDGFKRMSSKYGVSLRYRSLEHFIDTYKLPSLSTNKYGNPLDKYTLIPILLSGSLFVRKCGAGCSINKFTDELFRLDYIYKDYVFENDTHTDTYEKKYLKYKNKYLQLKKIKKVK